MTTLKTTLHPLSFFLTVLFVSCNSTGDYENKTPLNDTTIIQKITTAKLPNDTVKNLKAILPETFLFKYSECIGNCNDNERIISIKYKRDSLFLKIGSIQNCIGKFRPELKFHNDTLDIDIETNEYIFVKNKKGKIDTISTSLECDCYFYFEIGIRNLTSSHKTILLDGHKIGTKKSKNFLETELVLPTPEFIGGTDSLMIYIKRNIIYPELEKENKIQGTVYVSFTVDKEGKIKNSKILRGVNGGKNLDTEALRIVNNMPDWKPAESNNEKINAEQTLQIKFKL